jgi:hypothetical protein
VGNDVSEEFIAFREDAENICFQKVTGTHIQVHTASLPRKLSSICEISSSHGGEYEVQIVFWDVLPCRIIVDRRFRRSAASIIRAMS